MDGKEKKNVKKRKNLLYLSLFLKKYYLYINSLFWDFAGWIQE